MARKPKTTITLNMTEKELTAIVSLVTDISAMIGGGDNDDEWSEYRNTVDKMLKRNGYERTYK